MNSLNIVNNNDSLYWADIDIVHHLLTKDNLTLGKVLKTCSKNFSCTGVHNKMRKDYYYIYPSVIGDAPGDYY